MERYCPCIHGVGCAIHDTLTPEPTTITITFDLSSGGLRIRGNEQEVLDTFKYAVLDRQPFPWNVDEVYIPPQFDRGEVDLDD